MTVILGLQIVIGRVKHQPDAAAVGVLGQPRGYSLSPDATVGQNQDRKLSMSSLRHHNFGHGKVIKLTT
jgi:hypothetical protein